MHLYVLPALFALFVWWFSTGAIMYLDGLPRRTFRYSMIGATVLLFASFWGLQASAHDTTLKAAYCAFSCGLLAWGWQEISFYMGYVTGPRRAPCPEGCSGWKHFGHAIQTSLWHELAIIGIRRHRGGADLAPAQPDRHVDLHGALVDAPEREAQRVPRRAQPQRGVPAGPPAVPAQLPDQEIDEPAVPDLDHGLDGDPGQAGAGSFCTTCDPHSTRLDIASSRR